jgi:hypothetical protein
MREGVRMLSKTKARRGRSKSEKRMVDDEVGGRLGAGVGGHGSRSARGEQAQRARRARARARCVSVWGKATRAARARSPVLTRNPPRPAPSPGCDQRLHLFLRTPSRVPRCDRQAAALSVPTLPPRPPLIPSNDRVKPQCLLQCPLASRRGASGADTRTGARDRIGYFFITPPPASPRPRGTPSLHLSRVTPSHPHASPGSSFCSGNTRRDAELSRQGLIAERYIITSDVVQLGTPAHVLDTIT